MTLDNIKIVVTNARCCISELAAKVAKLFAIGDKCVTSELIRLKVLEDKVNLLIDYICDDRPNVVTNGTFEVDTSGWAITPPGSWFKDVQYGHNVIYYNANGNPGAFSQDCLEVGETYDISFGLIYDDDGADIPSAISIFAGDNYFILNTGTTNLADLTTFSVTLKATNPTFKISIPGAGVFYTIDNIVIKKRNQSCLTTDQIDKITHEVMKQCDICDCQLNLNNE